MAAMPWSAATCPEQEEQLASFRQLNQAEEQLSAVKSQRPGSHPQQAALPQMLQHAEQEVHAAAAAAQQASQKLELVLEEKEKVQQELQAIKQQLEKAPLGQQHAELYHKLVVGWHAVAFFVCSCWCSWQLLGMCVLVLCVEQQPWTLCPWDTRSSIQVLHKPPAP